MKIFTSISLSGSKHLIQGMRLLRRSFFISGTTLLLLCSSNGVQAQLMTQDFSSSSVVSDYVNAAAPTDMQFTDISNGGTATTISINAGRLEMVRSAAGGFGSFTRNADFSPVPSIMKFKADINVNTIAATGVSAIIFYIGDNFSNSSTPLDADVHAKLAINVNTAAGGYFGFRDPVGGVNGLTGLSTTNTISMTWIINNGSAGVYTAPNGNTESIPSDAWDLWIGTSKELNDRPVAAGGNSNPLANIKMVFNGGRATLRIDNINISQEATFLPVELTDFEAKVVNAATLLSFSTATESNNSHFVIERSGDIRTFTEIGRVQGAGTTQEAQHYTFTDEKPLSGINYYRLRQCDYDGQYEYSNVLSVRLPGKEKETGVFYPNPSRSGPVTLDYYAVQEGDLIVSVFDQTGRLVLQQTHSVQSERNLLQFDFSELTAGTYAVLMNNGISQTNRVLTIE